MAVFSRARGQSWWTRCKDAHGHCPHMDMVCCSLGTDAQLGLSLIIVDVHPYGIAPVVAHGIWNCGLRRVLGSGIRQAILTITCRRCFACASLSPSPSFTSFPIGLSVETLTDLSLLVVSTLVHPRRSWNSAWNSRTRHHLRPDGLLAALRRPERPRESTPTEVERTGAVTEVNVGDP